MEISTRQTGAATIVDVVGDITLFNSPQIRRVLLDLLKEKRVAQLLVNMKRVPYIDSSGIASLVEGLKVSRDRNSRLALFGLSKMAREVLELTRLTTVFEIHDTEEEAVNAAGPAEGLTGRVAGAIN
jgi:anti-sigma B factor antagonist